MRKVGDVILYIDRYSMKVRTIEVAMSNTTSGTWYKITFKNKIPLIKHERRIFNLFNKTRLTL